MTDEQNANPAEPTGASNSTTQQQPPEPAAPLAAESTPVKESPDFKSSGEKPAWPEDWRERVANHIAAGDDKTYQKELRRLQRLATPEGVYASYRELESWRDRGGFIRKPGKDAKPEELRDFRKALGVPEAVDGYFEDLQLLDGAVLGDADRQAAEDFAQVMHQLGASKEQFAGAMNWYFQQQQALAERQAELDESFRRQAEEVLREEYGPNMKRYVNSLESVFAYAPGGSDVSNPNSLYYRLVHGRMADGEIIGNDPDMLRFLVALAQEVNPAATVTSVEDGSIKGVQDRIAEIEKMMRENKREYFKSDAVQAEYRDLLKARDRYNAKRA